MFDLQVTGSFINGKMVGLAIDSKYFPGDEQKVAATFVELASVLGEPASKEKVGIHRDKDTVWRWFDVPQSGFLLLCASTRSPIPGSRTGAEIHYVRLKILDQRAFFFRVPRVVGEWHEVVASATSSVSTE